MGKTELKKKIKELIEVNIFASKKKLKSGQYRFEF